MTVQKMVGIAYLSDEDIVDYGAGTPAEQDAAYRRIEARREAALYAWLARPIWERAWIRLRYSRRLAHIRSNIAHAARALRGIECERE